MPGRKPLHVLAGRQGGQAPGQNGPVADRKKLGRAHIRDHGQGAGQGQGQPGYGRDFARIGMHLSGQNTTNKHNEPEMEKRRCRPIKLTYGIA